MERNEGKQKFNLKRKYILKLKKKEKQIFQYNNKKENKKEKVLEICTNFWHFINAKIESSTKQALNRSNK